MYRFVIVFLSFAFVFSGTIALSVDSVENSDDLIRLPLTRISRRRRAADGLTRLPLDDMRDVRYGVTVGIGTPPQNFDVALDTGSSDLWVVPAKSKNKDIKNLFDESKSSTFQNSSTPFFLGYAGGSVRGTSAIETVTLGDLTVKNQPFGLANSTLVKPYDGIMGFSYPAAAITDDKSIIDRLYEQGQIKKRVACVKARRKKDSKNSEFIMGGCDVEADSWTPVLQVGGRYTGWRLNLTKVIVRSTSDNSELLTLEPNNEAVVDTGGTDTVDIPTKFLTPITNLLGATYNGQHNLVNCANRTSLPNLEFYFGEAKVTIGYEDYSWTYFDECQLALNPGGEDFLFGTLFFNQATVIFDRDNNRVGFGPLK